MNPWGHLQAAEEARAGHGTVIKAETQRMGVSGECQQKPFPWEKGHRASSPKGTWLAGVPGVPGEGGLREAAAV